MRVFFTICAFSVFLSPTFCEKYRIETVWTSSGLTDGLFWKQETQQLLFVDTHAHKLYSYNALSKKIFYARIGNGLVSFGVPVENHPDKFVVGSSNDILLVTWNSNTNAENPPIKKLMSVDLNIKGNRINYGKPDPTGRLWFGTLNYVDEKYNHGLASLHSLDENLNLQTQIRNVSFSAGFVWSVDNTKFYYDDSLTYQVAVYDYDMKSGTVSEKRQVAFDLKKNNEYGLAGRLTIDTGDCLWVPIYGETGVIKIDPKSGRLLQTVKIEAKRVGAVTFGGPNLDILFVSTIGYGFNNASEKTPPNDKGGSIFAVTGLGVTGLPTTSYKLAQV